MPIDHFVLLMMENRSFDHYFGWLPRRRGRRAEPDATRTPSGAAGADPRHLSTLGTGGVQCKGCGHPDPGHGWDAGPRAAARRLPRRRASGNDEFALTYYDEGDLGFIHEAARNYTLYDRYFCSLLARPGRTATTSGRRSPAA